MKERTLYALLAMAFAVSRLGYYLLGVRFDARPVLHYYQFLDPELLKHRLFESLFYLHVQPPGLEPLHGRRFEALPGILSDCLPPHLLSARARNLLGNLLLDAGLRSKSLAGIYFGDVVHCKSGRSAI